MPRKVSVSCYVRIGKLLPWEHTCASQRQHDGNGIQPSKKPWTKDWMTLNLHSYFENAGWQARRVLEGMDSAGDFCMSKAAQVKLPKWTNGRALVLGDAAHATFGVGTSLAIESAYILAGELSTIKSSDEVPQALDRYEGIFRPMYQKMEDLPPGFPQMAFPQTAWGLGLRDSLLWIVSRTGLYKLFQGGGGNESHLPVYDWVE